MSLDDLLEEDSAIHVDADSSADVETVTYTFTDGTTRPISAQVFRRPPQPLPNMKSAATPFLAVFVRRHATLGVTAVVKNAEKITVAQHKGGSAVAMRIGEILSEDAGGFLLQLV